MKLGIIAGLFLLFTGLLCMVVAFFELYSNILFFKKAVVVPGTIVRYEERKSDERRIMYAAVVSFSFGDQVREVRASSFSSSPRYGAIGDIVKVAVNPANIDQARIKSMREIWPPIIVPLIFGMILLGMFLFTAEACAWPFPGPRVYNAIDAFMHSHPNFIVGALLWLGFGVSGGVGGFMLYDHIIFFKKAIRVPGTIVRYDSYEDTDRDDDGHTRTTTMYRKVVSYSFGGETREITSSFSSSRYDENTVGQTCEVGINPKNPYDARIYSKGEIILAVVLIGLGGILALVILGAFL